MTGAIGYMQAKGCIGIHLNRDVPADRRGGRQPPRPRNRPCSRTMQRYQDVLSAMPSCRPPPRPQTIGYSLADSPISQAAWIYAMFQDVSDTGGDAGSHTHGHDERKHPASLDDRGFSCSTEKSR